MKYANASWLTDTLATGGDLSFDPSLALNQMEELVAEGVTHILDTRGEADDADLWEHYPQVTYVHDGTEDAEGHNIPFTLFDRAVELGRQAEEAGGKLLVHCHMGVNRGPSVAAAVLMDRGYSAVQAFNMIRKARPIAAVYYLMDAFDAHARRTKVRASKGARKLVEDAWLNVIEDPKVVAHVTRAIQNHHRKDQHEMRMFPQE